MKDNSKEILQFLISKNLPFMVIIHKKEYFYTVGVKFTKGGSEYGNWTEVKDSTPLEDFEAIAWKVYKSILKDITKIDGQTIL